MFNVDTARIGVVGLGYVGLPLAVEFGRQFPTVGFDIREERIAELRAGYDSTLEVDADGLSQARYLRYSHSVDDLSDCNVYVVGVPTPVNKHKWPDLRPLETASRTVGKVLKEGDVVVYESTVYPGATEEVCVPILAAVSGLEFNRDFFVGYSPERINPGDKEHTLTTIRKITSGSTPETADFVDALYSRIIRAGTYKAESIRVAEAAKVIENTQRDVNIALMNELSHIFGRLGIDTLAVLRAAGTKWNFLPFRPGLVGGHCIGVDPYYLTHKAQETGYQPTLIPASRLINENMGRHVAERVVQLMAKHGIPGVGARVLVLGLTFKENCPDLRNTRCVDIVESLRNYGAQVDVHDPWVDVEHAEAECGITPVKLPTRGEYDAVVVAVAHRQFVAMGVEGITALCKPNHVIFDVKGILPAEATQGRL
ncbi:MAG: Vi polysaccharide biosynthesis UDP-N-acetylglucosamine C-6 dehydrogenase TviB [Thiohalomonadaceae bacterium]